MAAFDPDGAMRWSRPFGDAEAQRAGDVVIGPSDNAVVVGSIDGTTSFGGQSFTVTGQEDAFVASFSAATGAHQWSKRFGDVTGQGTVSQSAYSVAVDPAGNVIILGNFVTSIDFGGASLMSAAAGANQYVATFDSAGNHGWSHGYTSFLFKNVAADSAGSVVVSGSSTGTANFGGDDIVSDGSNLFVGKLSFNGEHEWSKSFDAVGAVDGYMTVDPADNLVLAGNAHEAVDFGGTEIQGSAGQENLFVAKLDPSGAHLWSHIFGDEQYQGATAVAAVDANTNAILVTGGAAGVLDVGTGSLRTSGPSDALVAKLAP